MVLSTLSMKYWWNPVLFSLFSLILQLTKLIARIMFIRRFFYLFITFTGVFILMRCSTSEYRPIERIQDQKEKFYAQIEDTAKKKYAGQKYQSLSYGEMKVYKPRAFIKLDSIYGIKAKYLKNNDQIGLRKSGIEDLIPGYRAAAQEEIDKVQYEIEHIFQTEDANSMHVYHSYYLFDYKDSLLSITPFYDFKIGIENQNTFYEYLFGYHFVDDRNLRISMDEQDFLHFFRLREVQLIGSDQLQPFMHHVMQVMNVAKALHTIDFREIGRQLALGNFKTNRKGENVTINKLGKLFEVTKNENIQYYELAIDWTDKSNKLNYRTEFKFSPYLEIVNVNTNQLNELKTEKQ